MKVEVEQKRLELEKQFGTSTTRHSSCTIKLPKLELLKFSGNGRNFGTPLKLPFTKILTFSQWINSTT